MTFPLEDEDAPQPVTGLPPAPSQPLSYGGRFDETVDAARLRLNSWSVKDRRAAALAEEIARQILPEGAHVPVPTSDRNKGRSAQIEALLGRAQQTMQGVPEEFIPFPTNREEFEAELNARLQAEYQDTQDALATAPGGSWSAELLGELWAGASDHTTVMTLPIGGPVTSGAAKFIGMGATAGVAAEALSLPEQFEMADRLGTRDPNAAMQLAFAGAISGVLSGGIYGGARYLQYRRDLGSLPDEQRTGDIAAPEENARIIEEEQRLRDGNNARPHDDNIAPSTQSPRLDPADVALRWNDMIVDETVGKIRNQPVAIEVQSRILDALQTTDPNLRAVLTSGGQDGAIMPGARRVGSTRHDHGNAADLVLMLNGRKITPDQEPEIYANFLRNAAAQGFTGLGHYRWGIHVGGGRAAAWGPSTTSADLDPLFGRAIREGWANPIEGRTAMGSRPRLPSPGDDVPTGGSTQRGYTRQGMVSAGDDMRVRVEYEVVDASLLRQATGDLQPRNRSRLASDEQIADIAAALDPARLMRSPEADRGAPVVGPDDVIESGNGRVSAINRAAERFPDRYAEYRNQIEAEGFTIPDGMERPVLIARRTSDLSSADRQKFVRQANTSAVARLSATERAAVDARMIGDDTMRLFDAAAPIGAPSNRGFARQALAALPQAERNALVDVNGALNREGVRRLREAMFARAYDAPDIIARYAETDAGDLRALVDALEEAAPAVAALRADIDAGRVHSEMDITGYIMDAVRLIASARSIAARESTKAAKIVDELLRDVDLLEGPVAPLTVALVRKFYPEGRALPADKIAAFVKRYAEEARKFGTTNPGLFEDTPGPLAVLQALDQKAFGALVELGPVRIDTSQPALRPDADALEGFDEGAGAPAAAAADDALAEDLRASDLNFDPITFLNDYGDANPEFAAALAAVDAVPSTHRLPGYGTDDFWAKRQYVAGDQKFVGKSAAVDYLYGEARKIAWIEDGLTPPAKLKAERNATIVIGAPAAGKSTIANPIARARGAAIIDADEAKKIIPEYDGGIGVSGVHIESGEIATDVLARALADGQNVVLPKVGGNAGSIEALISELKKLDYRVELIEVATPPASAVQRMIGRFEATGRLIPPDVMAHGIDGAPKTYKVLKEKQRADAYAKIDNSPELGQPRRVIEDDGIVPAELARTRPGGAGTTPELERAGQEVAGRDTPELDPDRVPSDQTADAQIAQMRASAKELRATAGDMEFELPDGTRQTIDDVLDDLDADQQLNDVLDACRIGRAA